MKKIPKQKSISNKFYIKSAEIISIFFWTYIITKFFVIDFDVIIIYKYFPKLNWLIKYKFFVLLVIICFFVIFFKGTNLLKYFAFILIYPFFLLFWRIPKLLLRTKNWICVFAALEIIISFFKRLKFNFAIFTFVIISALLILTTSSSYTLIPAITILFLFLINYFINRFKYAFNPFRNLTIQSETLAKIWNAMQEKFSLPKTEENIIETKYLIENPQYVNNLQIILIINKMCYFLISKLRNFKHSKVSVFYSIFNIIISVIVTIIIFGFINFALYKLNPDSFYNPNLDSFISFLYYSLNTIFTNGIHDFYPTGNIARLFNSIEIVFGFLILMILYFLLTTIFRERHNEQIDNAIITMKSQAAAIEKFMEKEYKLTPNQALDEIEKIKGSMLKIIYYFTQNIK